MMEANVGNVEFVDTQLISVGGKEEPSETLGEYLAGWHERICNLEREIAEIKKLIAK